MIGGVTGEQLRGELGLLRDDAGVGGRRVGWSRFGRADPMRVALPRTGCIDGRVTGARLGSLSCSGGRDGLGDFRGTLRIGGRRGEFAGESGGDFEGFLQGRIGNLVLPGDLLGGLPDLLLLTGEVLGMGGELLSGLLLRCGLGLLSELLIELVDLVAGLLLVVSELLELLGGLLIAPGGGLSGGNIGGGPLEVTLGLLLVSGGVFGAGLGGAGVRGPRLRGGVGLIRGGVERRAGVGGERGHLMGEVGKLRRVGGELLVLLLRELIDRVADLLAGIGEREDGSVLGVGSGMMLRESIRGVGGVLGGFLSGGGDSGGRGLSKLGGLMGEVGGVALGLLTRGGGGGIRGPIGPGGRIRGGVIGLLVGESLSAIKRGLRGGGVGLRRSGRGGVRVGIGLRGGRGVLHRLLKFSGDGGGGNGVGVGGEVGELIGDLLLRGGGVGDFVRPTLYGLIGERGGVTLGGGGGVNGLGKLASIRCGIVAPGAGLGGLRLGELRIGLAEMIELLGRGSGELLRGTIDLITGVGELIGLLRGNVGEPLRGFGEFVAGLMSGAGELIGSVVRFLCGGGGGLRGLLRGFERTGGGLDGLLCLLKSLRSVGGDGLEALGGMGGEVGDFVLLVVEGLGLVGFQAGRLRGGVGVTSDPRLDGGGTLQRLGGPAQLADFHGELATLGVGEGSGDFAVSLVERGLSGVLGISIGGLVLGSVGGVGGLMDARLGAGGELRIGGGLADLVRGLGELPLSLLIVVLGGGAGGLLLGGLGVFELIFGVLEALNLLSELLGALVGIGGGGVLRLELMLEGFEVADNLGLLIEGLVPGGGEELGGGLHRGGLGPVQQRRRLGRVRGGVGELLDNFQEIGLPLENVFGRLVAQVGGSGLVVEFLLLLDRVVDLLEQVGTAGVHQALRRFDFLEQEGEGLEHPLLAGRGVGEAGGRERGNDRLHLVGGVGGVEDAQAIFRRGAVDPAPVAHVPQQVGELCGEGLHVALVLEGGEDAVGLLGRKLLRAGVGGALHGHDVADLLGHLGHAETAEERLAFDGEADDDRAGLVADISVSPLTPIGREGLGGGEHVHDLGHVVLDEPVEVLPHRPDLGVKRPLLEPVDLQLAELHVEDAGDELARHRPGTLLNLLPGNDGTVRQQRRGRRGHNGPARRQRRDHDGGLNLPAVHRELPMPSCWRMMASS